MGAVSLLLAFLQAQLSLGVSHQGDAHVVMRRAISYDGSVSHLSTKQPLSNDHDETEEVPKNDEVEQVAETSAVKKWKVWQRISRREILGTKPKNVNSESTSTMIPWAVKPGNKL